MKKVLIMGLPGTGKTTFARKLVEGLGKNNRTVFWFNADDIRKMHSDWDFSREGRIRQAERMRTLANECDADYVICDFVAPLKEMRDIFDADYTVWMDTEKSSTYSDTDSVFENPDYGEWNYIVKFKDVDNTTTFALIDILQLR